ncbi:DNA damage-inducible protein 1 [Coemansia aciculifera]|uniref:DNA damage-inducible protein 1 n=1 Tax=Coemansia aciculifera TaxID=417176 RepID=A0A9W8IME5_9FUNG|nr:DNA damage-inducible protein 1 [Coemansia aciculifera]KAJ2875180.1 DNA damage-inducible protein 1 [Coemansia aciculifera]
MRLSITQSPDTTFAIEVDESMVLGDLCALLELECNIPVPDQILMHDGKVLSGAEQSLKNLELKSGDMVYIADKSRQPPPSAAGGSSAQPPALPQRISQGQGQLDPRLEAHRQQVLGNPQLMRQLAISHPDIVRAAQTDPAEFGRLLTQLQDEQKNGQDERDREMERLNANPFDIESQRKIEEMIRQENVMRNMETALELNPESFASVAMLYIDVVVNGTPIKALVDSGAQATVMSHSCAERCGIMRLVDTRFSGEARGVGKAKILGRVHNAELILGSQSLLCSFTVMEGAHIGLLFGLDMLRRHQMCIDLRQNALVIGEEVIEFLPEHLAPKSMEDDDNPASATPLATPPVAPPQPASEQPGGMAASNLAQRQQYQQHQQHQQHQQPLQYQYQPEQQQPLPPIHSEEKIASVMALGVSRDEAISSLNRAGGNPDIAASLIFS